MIRTDVVVLGAGAAGLAAARDLSLEGFRVVVLDARPRLGGRIATERDPSWPIPIDLGPEFIHDGRRRRSRSSAPRASSPSASKTPTGGRRLGAGRGWVSDFWAAAERITNRTRTTGRDRSVADFLRAQRSLSRRDRELLLSSEPSDPVSPFRLGPSRPLQLFFWNSRMNETSAATPAGGNAL